MTRHMVVSMYASQGSIAISCQTAFRQNALSIRKGDRREQSWWGSRRTVHISQGGASKSPGRRCCPQAQTVEVPDQALQPPATELTHSRIAVRSSGRELGERCGSHVRLVSLPPASKQASSVATCCLLAVAWSSCTLHLLIAWPICAHRRTDRAKQMAIRLLLTILPTAML